MQNLISFELPVEVAEVKVQDVLGLSCGETELHCKLN